MSEVFQTIQGDDAPLAFRKYDRIEFTKLDNGRHRLRGVEILDDKEKLRPLKIGEFVAGYGFNPEPQKPVRGIWKNDEHDTPVTINGFIGRYDGEDYLRAEGSNTGIPRSQLEWLPKETSPPAGGELEVQQLREEIGELKTQLESQQANFMEQLERVLAEHRQEKEVWERELREELDRRDKAHGEELERRDRQHQEDLETLRREQREEIDKLRGDLEKGEKPEDFEAGDEVKAVYEGRVVMGVINSEPLYDERKKVWRQEVRIGEEFLHPTIHELRVWQDLESTELYREPAPSGRFERAWLKTRGLIGGLTLRGLSQRSLAAVQSRYPSGRAYYFSPEEVYHEDEVDRGNKRLIAAAAAGVLVVGAYLLGRYTGNHNQYHEIKVPMPVPVPTGGHNAAGAVVGNGWDYIAPHASNVTADHLHFYNDSVGNHAFAVDLSHAKGFTETGHPGDYTISGPNGASVKHIQWKGNGPLAGNTLQRLKDKFPGIKFRLGHLFYKDHTGPGPRGWVKHYVTSIFYK